MRVEFENLFLKACNEGISIFTGAGFSINATNKTGKPLPLGAELSGELSAYFDVSEKLPLAHQASIIESRSKDDLYEYLKDRMYVEAFDADYQIIENLKINNWYTTNIDNLTERIFENSNKYYLNNNLIHGPSFGDRNAIEFYPLHGSILNESRPLIFNSLSIASTFSSNPKLWGDLVRSIEKYPTLFWGYSLNDSGILQTLNSIKVHGLDRKDKWVVLYKEMAEEEEYFKALGFKIIIASNKQLLSYFRNKIEAPILKPETATTTKQLFGQNFVPDSSVGLPLREINYFYLGAAPSWSDIFSPSLTRISHYSVIENAIFSNKNTIVVGTPATGKTTLMMQLAAFIEFKGHKIILEYPSIEKARYIKSKLSNQRALVFIDNFTDEIQSFLLLNQVPNIKLVGFDREHNFEIVSHFFDRSRFNIHTVTSLSESDIQQIFSSIPESIRFKVLKNKADNEDESPSMFEFISLNLKFPSIKSRYKNLIGELESRDELLTDFLLLASYVHQCRTPLSFDMAFSYFQDYIGSYKEIYDLRKQLGELLVDYSGDLVDDDDQDYFSPRSVLVSEAIMQQVQSKYLRRMLHRFLENLPPYKISNYNIFRKRGHDKAIMIIAFPDWEEGKYYYERLMLDNPDNPYILQQGALYLSHRKRYTEAFYWIERARNMTNDRVFSIRNSHAIILFEANIHKEGASVRSSLDNSMDILRKCYMEDMRKLYHAMKFGEQALDYFTKYGDKKSIEYLSQASNWTGEELENDSWHGRLSKLNRQINFILSKV